MTQQHSALARLQRTGMLAAWALALLCLWWWRERPLLALAVVLALMSVHAWVLALEFVLMAWQNRCDPAPRAGWRAVLGAWWVESHIAVWVFAWFQPFAWRRWPDTAFPSAATSGQRAVVLVHGFVCNRGLWTPWLRELRRREVPYATVNLEPVFGSIDDYAVLIEDAVARATAATGQPPLLVGHSMGGLAIRAWLRAAGAGAAQRVHHIVTLGTPHHGTWLARFSHLTNGRQMQPGGPWLRQLLTDEAASAYPQFTCWYSNADNIVFPASTATLPGADNRHIAGVPHVAMAFHPKVMADTLKLL
ncbi:esterase/lipase family protein [Hydrogenophaga atypica]|uniref:Esterase/lipase family protein n=1 Tax=Hydrogenophaga atypica TaxID=249409 RepID=A0ABW2QES9_9BURK